MVLFRVPGALACRLFDSGHLFQRRLAGLDAARRGHAGSTGGKRRPCMAESKIRGTASQPGAQSLWAIQAGRVCRCAERNLAKPRRRRRDQRQLSFQTNCPGARGCHMATTRRGDISRNSRPARSVSASSTAQSCRHCSGRDKSRAGRNSTSCHHTRNNGEPDQYTRGRRSRFARRRIASFWAKSG